MNSINKILAVLLAIFLWSSGVFAQTSGGSGESDIEGVKVDKFVVPNPNDPNAYTIQLETYVTGATVTKESKAVKPIDVLLIIDRSVTVNSEKYFQPLKDASEAFVSTIQSNPPRDDDGNIIPNSYHYVSMVSFGATDISYNRDFELAPLTDSRATQMIATIRDYSSNDFNKQSRTDLALSDAYAIFNGSFSNDPAVPDFDKGKSVKDDGRQKVIVLFAAGAPGTQDKRFNAGYARNSINTAYQLKTTKGIESVIYSVGLSNVTGMVDNKPNEGDATKSYDVGYFLHYLSSNYKFNFPSNSTYDFKNAYSSYGPEERKESGYYQVAEKDVSDSLKKIFESIGGEITSGGASYELNSETTTVIDILSSYFMLPEGADEDNIKVYTVDAVENKGYTPPYKFSENVNDWVRAEDVSIEIGPDKDGNERKMISVTGFDYASHYCGFDTDKTGNKTFHDGGQKLIIQIPIVVDPANPGGMETKTNAVGSGVYVNGEAVIEYQFPTVDVPNIIIVKSGLHQGESAVFKVTHDESGARSFTVVATCMKEGDDAFAVVKIQKPGRWIVEETGWSWAHDVEVLSASADYNKDRLYNLLLNHDPTMGLIYFSLVTHKSANIGAR